MQARNTTTSAPRAARAIGLAAALASLALGVAGCGGSSSAPPVASLAGTGSATTAAAAPQGGAPSGGPKSGESSSMQVGSGGRAFSVCMRSHGVPNFPDPNGKGELTFGSSDGIDPSSPKFQSAQTACQKVLPKHASASPAQVAKMQAMALKYSACMRSHGLPKFPDPTFSSGGVGLKIDRGSGIDPNSPQFQSAQKACQGSRPGAKTSGGPGGSTQQTGAP